MGNNSLPLALYGAGKLAVTEKKIVEAQGLNPVCFIDADVNKQGTDYLGLPVYSLDVARKKYGEFNIYVTPSEGVRYVIFHSLLKQGIRKERILNYEESEEYIGCGYLESQLGVSEWGMFFCCRVLDTMSKPPEISWKDDMEAVVSEFVDTRDRLIQAIRNGETNECSGCCSIAKGCYPLKKQIRSIAYGFNFPCQLSCIYCGAPNAKQPVGEDQNRLIREFDWPRFIRCLEERDLLAKETVISLAGGEITINPRKDELLDSMQKYNLSVFTNAVKYDERIATLTARAGNNMFISIDAGTRATYKKVKGLDVFDKVWANIKKSIERGACIIVKYIFLPENSNKADVEGFVYEALKTGVSGICISSDVFKQTPHTDEQIGLIARMLNMAKGNEISVTIDNTFKLDDIERINKAAMEALA